MIDKNCDFCRTSSNYTVAKMPVERFGSEYNMNHKKRGYALVFNHEFFEVQSLKARSGTSADCENLVETFQGLHFDVRVFKDLKYREIVEHIKHCKSF